MNLFRKILIANRGEVSVRLSRAAAALGAHSVAIYSTDDADALHVMQAREAIALPGHGVQAYLDQETIIKLAIAADCDALHPGYGFLSENADFARKCNAAGLIFIGPSADAMALFGDKGAARALAVQAGVRVAQGSQGVTTLEQMAEFIQSLDGRPAMIKALAGGGGRGMRVVSHADDLAEAFAQAESEAKSAFGSGGLYIEELIQQARHLEVQILGDTTGDLVHLFERECSLQRRHQKLVEIAPAPDLSPTLRADICAASLKMAKAAEISSLCTFEFLVTGTKGAEQFVFMEANPRLQVEHTITEEIMGIDLAQTQIRLAAGETLSGLGITQETLGVPRGMALEARVNMERIQPDGTALPQSGTLHSYLPPGGGGVRTEGFGYTGYTTNTGFDSLLAKVITFAPNGDYTDVLDRTCRALGEFRIDGVETNISFLQSLLRHPTVQSGQLDVGLVERLASDICKGADDLPKATALPTGQNKPAVAPAGFESAPDGMATINTPVGGLLISVDVSVGSQVAAGQQIAIVEAMKMEHVVQAQTSGQIGQVLVAVGAQLAQGQPIAFLTPSSGGMSEMARDADADTPETNSQYDDYLASKAKLMDENRPAAVARRRKTGQQTARENIAQLCDTGSFVEYGGFALAAQRRRRTIEELTEISPADGLVSGLGTIHADQFPDAQTKCLVMAYDFTVFAGTQGFMNHKKMDRLLKLALKRQLPIVLFAEGGGGRPGETDYMGVAGLELETFHMLASHSGTAPTIAIVSGRCFAGNAALAGSCDVIIATENANLGMGGPAMIEGGGLGVFTPEQVGPMTVQTANGVVDVLVADEPAAVETARKYMSYFQGDLPDWSADDQTVLRDVIPQNRLRVYDVQDVIQTLVDHDSILELRPNFGIGIVTALVRVGGMPMGLIANNPKHLGGAIDAEAADKAARFIDLCEGYGLPILSLCDTPGFMVGPDAEETALVRRVSRMFVSGANTTVPFFTVVLRKAYGLGALGMAAGCFLAPDFNMSWPTGEFGGMGLEGAVRLAYRNELAAIDDPDERQAMYEKLVAELYERGKAVNMAAFLEIDDVIDPADTRDLIIGAMKSATRGKTTGDKRRSYIPTR
jgi:acetyl/propionyl-CoA carboxylase alpha subunit/acetyl-CoA carboxylase carboxyltransferase component